MRLRVSLLLAAVFAAATLSAQAPPAPSFPQGSNLVVGRVVDGETGTPIAAAVVTMSAAITFGRAAAERVLTDARGRFFFSGIGPGSFNLTATKPGWIDGAAGRKRPAGAADPIEIRDTQPPPEAVIPLWRYGVVTGRIGDEQDEPLVGVDVRIFQGDFAGGRRQWTFVERSISDDRGIYRFSRVLPGSYLVVVPAAVTSEPASFRGPADLPNSYYQTMSPIGVSPMSFDAARTPAGTGPLITSILNLPRPPSADGAWLTYPTTYFPSATSQERASVIDVGVGQERASVDIAMRPVPTFTVSGSLGTPPDIAPGYHAVHLLAAESADNPLFDVATAITNAAGEFTFYGVPQGQYIARIVRVPAPVEGQRFGICGGTGAITYLCTLLEKPPAGVPPIPTESLLHADAPVTVADRNVRGVALELRPGARVSGRTEFEGAAKRPTVAEWRTLGVSLDPAGGQMFKAHGGYEQATGGRFSDDGRFTIPSGWPGRYVIRLATPPPGWHLKSITVQGRDVADTPFDLVRDLDDVVITFTDQIARLGGTVQASNGQPDPNAAVLVFPTDPARWMDYGRFPRRLRLVSVTGGSYSTLVPPDGEYFLIALPESQLLDWQNPAFLKRAAAVADRLTVRAGQPMTHGLRTRSLP